MTTKLRDACGRFVNKSGTSNAQSAPSTIISKLFPTGIYATRNADENTLLDIHIGNPLRKITVLLEEIKKQKAFSFDIKGSLGVTGVLVALTTFGIFGGTHALCSKGRISQLGTMRILAAMEIPETVSSIPVLTGIGNWYDAYVLQKNPSSTVQRVILINQNESAIRLVMTDITRLTVFDKASVIATGDYDSCSQTLAIKDLNDIEANP